MRLWPQELRLRLVSSFVVLLLLTALNALTSAVVVLALVLALFGLTGKPLPWRRLVHLEGFLILLLLTLPFTLPGDPLFSIGPLVASVEGARRALLLALKVTASVLLLALFFADVEPLRLGNALRALGVPEPLVRIFITATRTLGVIRDEFARLQDAMRARAFTPATNRHSWKSYGNLIGMVLVRGLDRAERVEEAMRLRGYQGRFLHSSEAAPKPADWMASLALVAGTAFLLLGERL